MAFLVEVKSLHKIFQKEEGVNSDVKAFSGYLVTLELVIALFKTFGLGFGEYMDV